MTIAAEECGINNIFVLTGIATGYTWNSAPIDGINILRGIRAIDRKLHFSIDINPNVVSKII